MDVAAHNKAAWDAQVEAGNPWTIPVSTDVIDEARRGNWSIVLTPRRLVPAAWFPPLSGMRVLALACGGGQQGPVLAAAGAQVTVLDNSPRQLAQDRTVAEREHLDMRTVEGDMRDLSIFAPATFDLIVHPVSNCFVPEVRTVWREAARVLKAGGLLLAGFCNPVIFLTDAALEGEGIIRIKHAVPYSDLEALGAAEQRQRAAEGEPLHFGHSLEDQIGGQIDAGFAITGFYEDRHDPRTDPLSRYLPGFMATRAEKRSP